MYKRIINKYIKITNAIGWICGFVATIGSVCIILLTVGDVFMRFFFNKPINGSFELTEYLLVILVFMAIPWATTKDAHVRVDLLTGKLKKRKQAMLYAISCLISIFISFLIAWYTLPEGKYAYELKEKSDMLNIPSYPFHYFIAFGFFILVFILIAVLIRYLKKR